MASNSASGHISLWQHFVLGGTAAGISTIFTNPIDVVKVRLQMQRNQCGHVAVKQQPVSNAKMGMWRTAVSMVREEGMLSLWAGMGPALYRTATYSATRIGLYNPIRDALMVQWSSTDSKESPESAAQAGAHGFAIKCASGILSGAIGALCGNPFELVKVRMQAGMQSGFVYRSTFHALASIRAEDGVRGFYKGVGPAIVRASLLTASQLASYDEAKTIASRMLGLDRSSLQVNFTAAMLAGIATTAVTSPADVVKTRMMNARGLEQQYRSSWDCISRITAQEGPAVLFKGFVPSYVRLGPQTVISLLVYDQLRTLLGWSQL
ncbi:Mitochondrial substrate carrier family protein ucpB [Porphyridium purpureum]|uniref:Mitochondrial substrate carrier family protein ucpB n=1 Tax=Porphyridium purpureum TaxID=35688 RepID=A0A5J4YZQ0_PORPP|nr:Mitochondrial substrate carrier family protein ucpB [Porphyridium purpureum]|eukprot:POR9584..scf208_2